MNEQQQPAPSVPDGWRLVPYTPTALMLERAEYAVNNRPQPSRYEPSATPAIIFWTAMLKYAPEAPTPAEAPADVARWIDPNDKTQKQYLPHVGERVLFCHDGRTYYGKHTGGSFISFTHPGNTYPTWGCHWMYPPKATDAAMSEKGQS